MGIEVDVPTLNSIARALRNGGEDVSAMASGAPTGVDAGDMTGLLTSMLVDVTENAATVVEGMHNSAEAVRTSHDTYVDTETGIADQMLRHRAGPMPGAM